MILAEEEARLHRQHYVGTEHLLLGLIHVVESFAVKTLESLGVSTNDIRDELDMVVGEVERSPGAHIPMSIRSKKALELAAQESELLGHNYVGTEHLLLGLINEGQGVAFKVLAKRGVILIRTRHRVVRLLSGQFTDPDASLITELDRQVPVPGPVREHERETDAPDRETASDHWDRETARLAQTVGRAPLPPRLWDVDSDLAQVHAAKDEAIDRQDWQRAAELRLRERDLLERGAVMTPSAPRIRSDTPAPHLQPDPGGRLPVGAESSVVMIGTAEYQDPALPDMPAIGRNLADLTDLLADSRYGGFERSRIHTFLNPQHDVAGHLAEIAEATTDTLLVYYAGHGVVPSDGQLYLCLPTTRSRREMYSSVPYHQIRRALVDSPARKKIVILDCCFAGRAIEWMADSNGLAAGQLDVTGTYLLTATSATRPAHIPEGARNSAFTAALLELLRDGAHDSGSMIRIADLYPWLLRTLRGRGLPSPQQRGSDTIGDLALARNPAWSAGLERGRERTA
jgi:hypothetical protein